jgi:hypothetical protein
MISIVLAAIYVPYRAALDPNPRRGVKRMAFQILAFNAAYVAYLTLVHVKVYVPHW